MFCIWFYLCVNGYRNFVESIVKMFDDYVKELKFKISVKKYMIYLVDFNDYSSLYIIYWFLFSIR